MRAGVTARGQLLEVVDQLLRDLFRLSHDEGALGVQTQASEDDLGQRRLVLFGCGVERLEEFFGHSDGQASCLHGSVLHPACLTGQGVRRLTFPYLLFFSECGQGTGWGRSSNGRVHVLMRRQSQPNRCADSLQRSPSPLARACLALASSDQPCRRVSLWEPCLRCDRGRLSRVRLVRGLRSPHPMLLSRRS